MGKLCNSQLSIISIFRLIAMQFFPLFSLLLLSLFIESDAFFDSLIKNVVQKYDDALTCIEPGEACTGILPQCCEGYKCVFEEGYTWGKGRCLECVEEGSTCQKSYHCCNYNEDGEYKEGELQCDREMITDLDGKCSAPRDLYMPCHQHDQCKSKHCKRPFFDPLGNCVEPKESKEK